MTTRARITSASIMLMLGEGLNHSASFVRYMILARVLTKADFAIAATLSMVMVLFEFSAKMGISRFIIRDKDGGLPGFVASAHMMQFAVSLIGVAMVALAAWPLALLFSIPDVAWAFWALGLIFLLNSVQHLDVCRYQREFRFGPYVVMEIIPQLAILLATWPVAVWLGDYRAVLVLLIGKAAASCLLSHGLAEQPYRWQWSRVYVSRMLRFGWPLMVSAFLLFVVTNGDKFLVATYYSMEDMAPYAAAVALVMVPGFLFGRIHNPVALPFLAQAQDDQALLVRRYRQTLAVAACFCALYGVALIVGADILMRIAYGAKYVDGGILLAWLAAASVFRILRMPPALAAIARGDSINLMISNLLRVTSLVPALILALMGHPLWLIAGTGLLGEVAACWISFHRLKTHNGVPFRASLMPALWLVFLMSVAGSIYAWGLPDTTGPWAFVIAAASGVIAASLTALVFSELRGEVLNLARRFRSGAWPAGRNRHPAGNPAV